MTALYIYAAIGVYVFCRSMYKFATDTTLNRVARANGVGFALVSALLVSFFWPVYILYFIVYTAVYHKDLHKK